MDGYFWLQNGLKLFSRICTSRPISKKAHKMTNLMVKTIYKISNNFSENAVFRMRKKSVFQEISTFSVFFFLVLLHYSYLHIIAKMRVSNFF